MARVVLARHHHSWGTLVGARAFILHVGRAESIADCGRTPLYDVANWAENLQNLLYQIEMAVTPDRVEDEQIMSSLPAHFSPEDVREELERLRNDEQPTARLTDAGGICSLPSQVPELPQGLRISTEMKQVLATLLTSENRRIGFAGMVRWDT